MEFHCSRKARGAIGCDLQCAECATQQNAALPADCIGSAVPVTEDQVKAREEMAARSAENAKAVIEEQTKPAGPQPVYEVRITLYDNGTMNVQGPFHDRIAFKGMLEVAADIERDMFHKAQDKAKRDQEKLNEMPWFQRKLLERRERKAREAAAKVLQAAWKRCRDVS
jgi:hypothetical protein